MVNLNIDPRLQAQFDQNIGTNDNTPGEVDAKEARALIDMALEVNKDSITSGGCCGLSKSGGTKGQKDLELLLDTYTDKFESIGREQIKIFVATGKIVDPRDIVVPFGNKNK